MSEENKAGMEEEGKKAEEGKKVADGGNEEGKKAEESGEDGKYNAEKIAELERKSKIFDALDAKYKSDPKYKEVFDKAWKGDYSALKEEEEEEKEPIEQLRDENKKIKEELTNLKSSYQIDRITGDRRNINARYEEDFKKLALEVGYEPGSAAFDILYSDTVREGYALARKFGLTTDSGDADPLKSYSEKFMKEAFKVAFDKQKRAGFDEAWKRKKEIEKEKKKETYVDEVEEFFKPEKLKTPADRAKALELAFRKKFKGQNLKLV